MFVIQADSLFKESDIWTENCRNIHSDTYVMEHEGNRFIVKVARLSFIRRVINNLKRGKAIAFVNEIKLYERLDPLGFKYFRHPKLIESDGRSYMVIEYVDGSKGWDKDIVSHQFLISALLEFQFSNIKICRGFFVNCLFKLHRNIPWKIVKWSFRLIDSPRAFLSWVRCAVVLLDGIRAVKKIQHPILTHNDLFNFNNMITSDNGEICFYDFEYVHYERKWFLIDILDLSFDLETLELDTGLFGEYIARLSKKMQNSEDLINIQAQIRIILLRKLLGVMVSRDKQKKTKTKCREFIISILLNKQNYDIWYDNNISGSCDDSKII